MPSTDQRFLLKLLQLEIGGHPPQTAIVVLALHAEAGHESQMQLGLFTPQTPEPSRLDVTLARLRALVGEERVGSLLLEDTHRAGAFRMEGFANPGLRSETRSTQTSERAGEPTLATKTKTSRGWVTRDAGVDPTGWGADDALVNEAPRMALRRVRPARAVRVLVSPANALKSSVHGVRARSLGLIRVAGQESEHDLNLVGTISR